MSLVHNNFPARGFLTPPPTCNSRRLIPSRPATERKYSAIPAKSPENIINLPSLDSPYGRAKHVQLVDKNPNKAVSMFWTAINAGDRVDSALKDMAVVMKQLDRSDEAIEAIKSFRHLCPTESQDSLDNILLELYKRCGRTDELIQIIQAKLKQIEKGSAFGGKRVKAGRSQGKKKDITIEQEYARLLGNLAWAYLQQGKYKSAEEMYRNSLSFELDRNKQCNLAVCLMHMNRMTEAKLLLQTVSDSCGNREMDESYAKAYERAMETLTRLESRQDEKTIASAKERQVNCPAPFSPFKCRGPEGCTQNGGPKRWFQSSPQDSYGDKWKKATFGCQSNVKWGRKGTSRESFMFNQEDVASSLPSEATSEVLLTQPRRCPWSFGDKEKKDAVVPDVNRKLIFGEVNAEIYPWETSNAANCIKGTQTPSEVDSVKKPNSDTTDSVKSTEAVELIAGDSEVNHEIQSQSKSPRGKDYQDFVTWTGKKSWADIAEEEEQDLLNGRSTFQ
ncbi:putative acetyltransferase A, auxiliary subunit [Heracleum sosnowskyi]|uniref:Acetyltransferase A, auxiliary subunit n=1 Tax=Heracleum sosnowskyi TaxID=360622 RepID=A0AAD8HL07_9APIA|nr:putative acetyltransferase A, auxiliary subunit [Heracleum sosnowskyi]